MIYHLRPIQCPHLRDPCEDLSCSHHKGLTGDDHLEGRHGPPRLMSTEDQYSSDSWADTDDTEFIL